ncbi:MAG: hypothetical protein AUK47_02940 [Deltaproteobacteria bacterium CG2_30_63_29]|nr:MAG: hypothetical protein AUK47_02940 [Deltaproteobacteria bacterium CG2_30_63_29]PJB35697.1 MAG: RNA polymerase subunit sigma-70 [Deltaproteobacteria bacterium CG_4_9_14_3_um_filter_63_12]
MAEHEGALRRVARIYAGQRADYDDLLQEIAFAVWGALPRFEGKSSLRTFLFRIAHNRGIRFLAQHRSSSSTRGSAGDDFADLVDTQPDPESTAISRQKHNHVVEAVQNLPLALRQILSLAMEQLSHREIAEVLGISESNVAVRLHRARQALRALLEKNHGR